MVERLVLRTGILWSMGLVAELRESCCACTAYYTMGDALVYGAGCELRESCSLVLRTIPWAILWSLGLDLLELRESCCACTAYTIPWATLVCGACC
jgi:hypothetical protein